MSRKRVIGLATKLSFARFRLGGEVYRRTRVADAALLAELKDLETRIERLEKAMGVKR